MIDEQVRDHCISCAIVQHHDRRKALKRLTLLRMTSYAEMRSVATNSNVLSSTSKISRTLPDAIFLMLYWLRSTLVTAVLEAMMCDCRPVFIEFFLLQDVVSCCVVGGSCDSGWLMTGVLIFLRAKSENLRHWQGLSRAPRNIQCCMSLPFTHE